jgi:DNA-binding response OmpR family regulator
MNSSEHSQAPDHSGSVVVIVDDNDGVRHMLSLALETAGFAVVETATQLDLQRYLAVNRPDALVINLQRAEADGLELLLRIRARPSLRDVPILFLAGSDAEDFRYDAVTAGADWFGLRPFGMIELQNRIAELIQTGRAPAPAQAQGKRRPQPVLQLKPTG